MTGIVAILLAVTGGLIVSTRRQLVLVVVVPFVAILAVQTWGIGSGRGVSPPSTVDRFPDVLSYLLVQVIIAGLALGVGDQIRLMRGVHTRMAEGRQTLIALVVNLAWCGVVVGGFLFDRQLLDPGSVVHHRSNGSPPVLGVVGILLLVASCAGLALWRLVARRTRSARRRSAQA